MMPEMMRDICAATRSIIAIVVDSTTSSQVMRVTLISLEATRLITASPRAALLKDKEPRFAESLKRPSCLRCQRESSDASDRLACRRLIDAIIIVAIASAGRAGRRC